MRHVYRAGALAFAVAVVGCSDGNDRGAGSAGDAGTDAGSGRKPPVVKDSDGDGISDYLERPNGSKPDSDRDGIPNYLDEDDDGDGISTKDESDIDSDHDGLPDYLDEDDDNDGIPTKDELDGGAPVDSDGDGVWDHLQPDPQPSIDGGVIKKDDCLQVGSEADLTKRPVDIVFIIDNSSSMDSEIKAVQNSINTSFAGIIDASKIDFRVIMLADFGYYHGSARSVCISGTLNPGQSCPDDVNDAVYTMAPVITAGKYYHYDVDGATHAQGNTVDSKNSLCRALEWIDKADGFGLAPNGWGAWLRPEAQKVFVEVTDDQVSCSADLDGDGTAETVIPDDTQDDPNNATDVPGEWSAATFDGLLLAQAPTQFGTSSARNYIWHSLVSVPVQAAPNENQPYTSTAPIQGAGCASSANPSRGYEALSRLTGGLRFPVCAADPSGGGNLSGFDSIFNTIAQGVVQGSKVQCDFPLPAPPAGETLDRTTVEAVYTPGNGDPAESFRAVSRRSKCTTQTDRFYFDGDTIVLCPDTCTRVQADPTADIQIRFGCTLPAPGTPPRPLPEPPVIE